MAVTTIETNEKTGKLAQRIAAHADLGGGLTRSDLQRAGAEFFYVVSRDGRTIARASGKTAKDAGKDLVAKVGEIARSDSRAVEVAAEEAANIDAEVKSATAAAAAAYQKAAAPKSGATENKGA